MGILSKLGCDVALYVSGESIRIGTNLKDMATIPAYVSTHKDTRRVLAVGEEARQMLGNEPGNILVQAVFKLGMPMESDVTEALFRYCLKKYIPKKLIPPRVVLSGQMSIESGKLALKEAATAAGSREVLLLEAPMAAAIGLGLEVEEPIQKTLLHFEKDWMSVSVISLAGIVAQEFEPIGADTFLQDISIYAKETLGFAPELNLLREQFKQSGFDSSISPIGWEAWTDSIETGKETIRDLYSKFITKACSPTFLRIREVYTRCLGKAVKEKRIQLNASPIHLSGEYSSIPHFAQIIGNHLHKEVLAYKNSERAAYDGTVNVLSEISTLLPYRVPKRR